jgi:hypothetical protein
MPSMHAKGRAVKRALQAIMNEGVHGTFIGAPAAYLLEQQDLASLSLKMHATVVELLL